MPPVKDKPSIATSTVPTIADLAREFEVKPGQVFGVLGELGIEHDGQTFAAASSGSSTHPRLCGVPNDARVKAWMPSPPLK